MWITYANYISNSELITSYPHQNVDNLLVNCYYVRSRYFFRVINKVFHKLSTFGIRK